MEETNQTVVQEEIEQQNEGTVRSEQVVDKEKQPTKKDKFLKALKKFGNRYFIVAFSGMATGLFCTLIAGTIICQIAKIFQSWWLGGYNFINNIGTLAKFVMGAGIGLGIANSLKCSKLTMVCAATAGFIGAFSAKIGFSIFEGTKAVSWADFAGVGEPISSYLCAVIACEFGELVVGKTKIDILVVPLTSLLSAGLVAFFLATPISSLMAIIGDFINLATKAQPFFMGIIISVTMGLLLTLPTSSAAIGVAIGLSGIAAGAAVAGCCAHMVGFAIASFKENRWAGVVAQGVGTSMLQIPNLKKPQILLPAVIASAITGPLATCLFKLQSSAVGSGMGTSGLVGVIETIGTMTEIPGNNTFVMILGVLLICFILPAVIAWAVSLFMRKKGWLKDGDMKIDL